MSKKQAIKLYTVPLEHIDDNGELKSDAKLYGLYSDFYHNNDTYPMGEKLTYSNAKNRHQGRTYDIFDHRSVMWDDAHHMGIPIDKRGWSALAYASKPDREDSLFDEWQKPSALRDDDPTKYVITTDAETGKKHREPIQSASIMSRSQQRDEAYDDNIKLYYTAGISGPVMQAMKEPIQHAEALLDKHYHYDEGNGSSDDIPFKERDNNYKLIYFRTGEYFPYRWDDKYAYKVFLSIVNQLKDASYRKRDESMIGVSLKDAYDIDETRDGTITTVPILVEFDDDDIIRADDVLKNGYDPGRDFQQEAQLKSIINKQMIPNKRFRDSVRAYRGIGDKVEGQKNLHEMLKDIQQYFDYDNPMTLSDEHLKYIISDCAHDARERMKKETTKNIVGLLKPKYGI